MINIFEKISKVNTTLIGYDSISKPMVDKIIEYIPNKSIILSNNDLEIKNYLDSPAFYRDIKISNLLNVSDIYLILDISRIEFTDDDNDISRSKLIRNLITYIQKKMYESGDSETDSIKIKAVFMCEIFAKHENNVIIKHGTHSIYVSDFVFYAKNNKLHLVKDRRGSGDEDQFDMRFISRDFQIDEILK